MTSQTAITIAIAGVLILGLGILVIRGLKRSKRAGHVPGEFFANAKDDNRTRGVLTDDRLSEIAETEGLLGDVIVDDGAPLLGSVGLDEGAVDAEASLLGATALENTGLLGDTDLGSIDHTVMPDVAAVPGTPAADAEIQSALDAGQVETSAILDDVASFRDRIDLMIGSVEQDRPSLDDLKAELAQSDAFLEKLYADVDARQAEREDAASENLPVDVSPDEHLSEPDSEQPTDDLSNVRELTLEDKPEAQEAVSVLLDARSALLSVIDSMEPEPDAAASIGAVAEVAPLQAQPRRPGAQMPQTTMFAEPSAAQKPTEATADANGDAGDELQVAFSKLKNLQPDS